MTSPREPSSPDHSSNPSGGFDVFLAYADVGAKHGGMSHVFLGHTDDVNSAIDAVRNPRLLLENAKFKRGQWVVARDKDSGMVIHWGWIEAASGKTVKVREATEAAALKKFAATFKRLQQEECKPSPGVWWNQLTSPAHLMLRYWRHEPSQSRRAAMILACLDDALPVVHEQRARIDAGLEPLREAAQGRYDEAATRAALADLYTLRTKTLKSAGVAADFARAAEHALSALIGNSATDAQQTMVYLSYLEDGPQAVGYSKIFHERVPEGQATLWLALSHATYDT